MKPIRRGYNDVKNSVIVYIDLDHMDLTIRPDFC